MGIVTPTPSEPPTTTETNQTPDTEPDIVTEKALPETPDVGNQDQAPVIDQAAARSQLGLDQSIYQEILQEYFKENVHTAQLLQSQINTADYAAARQTVHKLKSSSGSIGARRIAKAASDLQHSLEVQDVSLIQEQNVLLQMLLHRALAEIQTGA